MCIHIANKQKYVHTNSEYTEIWGTMEMMVFLDLVILICRGNFLFCENVPKRKSKKPYDFIKEI